MRAGTAWVRTICLIMFAFAPALAAEEVSVELDPSKTEVAFVLSDVLHTVHGTFRLKEGRVSFNPDSNAMKGEIVVDAASGSSGSNVRDKRMTRDILEAHRFREIRFNPTASTGSISLSGLSDVQVTGSFVIHGQAHNVTIPMHVQMSQDQLTATGKFVVPYVEWGMKNPSNFLLKVNDKVEIDLSAVGRIKRGNTTTLKIKLGPHLSRVYQEASSSGNGSIHYSVQSIKVSGWLLDARA
jgi:polyisoprenoid-binding protein YceI